MMPSRKLRGIHQRPRGRDRALEHEGSKVGASGIHRGGVSRRAGADDDDVMDRLGRLAHEIPSLVVVGRGHRKMLWC